MTDQTPTIPAVEPAAVRDRKEWTYTETVIDKIRNSPVYVGDGGFIAQAMEADTIEEATQTGELWRAQDYLGNVFVWQTARFADSDLDGTLPFFAICDVVNTSTGEKGQLSVGGARVIATLFRACEANWFPFDASLEEVQLSGAKAALNLVVAPAKVKNTKTA